VPRISVLMSVFNDEAHLRATVESLRAQTFEDWELVLVDDGSTDGTPRVLADLAERDPRIVALRHANQGLTLSLGVAAAAARGLYLARLDSGDQAEPERLARQKAALDEQPDLAAVGSHVLFVTPEGWPVNFYRCPLTHEEIDGGHIAGLPGQMAHAGLMLRRSSFDRIGGYCADFAVAQDYDLLLRLAEIGQLGNLDRVLTRCSLSLAGVSSRRRGEQVRLAALALSRARARRGLPAADSQPRLWTPEREEDLLEKWMREALVSGFPVTARRLGWRLLRQRPGHGTVRLLARAMVEACRTALHRRPTREARDAEGWHA